MKPIHQLFGSMLLVLAASGSFAEGDQAIDLAVVGDLSPAMAERVRAFAEENLALAVRLNEPLAAGPAENLNAIGQLALERLGAPEVCRVVLAVPLEEHSAHGILMPGENTAVVNAKLLQPEDNDEERYGRRLERETMMSIGLLLGHDPCPNPQCAMWLYSNTEELDLKGRNFCPPCMDRVQKLGIEKGLRVIRESPFAPIPEEAPVLEAGETPAAVPAAESEPAAVGDNAE